MLQERNMKQMTEAKSMKRNSIIFIILLVWMQNPVIQAEKADERRMNMVFYMQAKVTTPNATAVRVAGPNGETSETKFGTIFVINDVLTEGQSNTSRQVGRAEGTISVASLQADHAYYVWSAILKTGTIAFQGTDKAVRNEVVNSTTGLPISGEMEHSIVGGTGDYQFALGYANFTHVELNLPDSVIFINASLFFPSYSLL